MVKFVLCDDNLNLLTKLKEMIELIFLRNDFDAKIVFSTTSPKKLLDFLDNNDANVLFLDIDLKSQLNGIDIAKKIRKTNKSLYLIFLTAHFEYIISAFECKTFDFIQKPFHFSKLENTIKRLFNDITEDSNNFIKLHNQNKLINQNLVNYIKKDGAKVIYFLNNSTIESYDSFVNILNSLPSSFVRCHKSYIVNINNISHIDFSSDTIFFKSSPNYKCYIGQKYKQNLREVFTKNESI